MADSLDNLKKEKDPFFNKLTRILTTRTMNEVRFWEQVMMNDIRMMKSIFLYSVYSLVE